MITCARLDSKEERGGKEESTQAYHWYVEETDDAANEVMPMKANEHQEEL